ncbi:3-keto-5-aminohexanoate cleavage protein [Geosporobacter ferrireducens]|uniref:3-keto-5-aminohexanoate cleavage protein n=1 Tax=Geosporobacter ferrireducens TaxID=1424294 RepID=A0A1D8GG30_9FIRM|nr:3-keto-5-aminohexanoate cleavage protein [Geosporobacter ferrireducens]AOT69835.1 3-keto-5-aminohexanoate cleavage protein [Geosporobacter ferrireducens]MTI54473.1 3-keto-5-aminohexanoate cleavage protein [Geosporobacter ferrireducens]
MNKTIITVATTGAWPSKQDNPNVPLTPQEIANDVYECWKAGAAIAHLHMRDDNGKGTMSKEKFEETVALIKEKCDIILNLTTSGDLNATDETRQAHLKSVKPELASYDCGSMNWMHNSLFINHPKFLEELGHTMQEYGVKPEIEIFDAGMIYNSFYYQKKGVLKAPLHYQFVLGAAGGMTATIENLVFLKNLIPEGSTWSALGIGKGHIPIMLAAIAMGGHVRVGMEDNVYFGPGELAKSNAQFVERAANIIRASSKEVAAVEDARNILGL